MSRLPCVNCGSTITECVYQHQEQDMVEQVWICEDCPAEFEAHYDLFECELTEAGQELIQE